MKRVWCVVEGAVVWGAFHRRRDAVKFRKREFGASGSVHIATMAVYRKLKHAPTTDGDYLECSMDLEERAAT